MIEVNLSIWTKRALHQDVKWNNITLKRWTIQCYTNTSKISKEAQKKILIYVKTHLFRLYEGKKITERGNFT